jgi:hypothetical protein
MFAKFSAVREKFGRRNQEPIASSSTAPGHDTVRRPFSPGCSRTCSFVTRLAADRFMRAEYLRAARNYLLATMMELSDRAANYEQNP